MLNKYIMVSIGIALLAAAYVLGGDDESYRNYLVAYFGILYIGLVAYNTRETKRNNWYGVRTAWTLASDENWQNLHGKFSEIGVYITVIFSVIFLYVPRDYFEYVFLSYLVSMVSASFILIGILKKV